MSFLTGSFIVLSALLIGATEGTVTTVYTVGDSLGWRVPPNESYYSDWASTKTFFVGDKLGKFTSPAFLVTRFSLIFVA